MGRKGQNKQSKASKPSALLRPKEENIKLSPQKRSELNQIVDKLLKVTSVGVNSGKIRDNHIIADKLLNKIISIESGILNDLLQKKERIVDKITVWMFKNDAKIDGVEIGEFDGYGYGLKAVKDIKEGDLLICVPRKLMMTTEFARTSELEFLCKNDPMLAHMPNIILALFLLLEKFKEDSFWKPYIESLPTSYTTVMCFTLQELDELKGSPTYEPAMKQCQNVARQYGYLYNLFQNSSDPASLILKNSFTYEQYRWAVSTVMTRQNFIPASNPENPMILALIPYWDMGNHANAKLTTDYNVEIDQSEYYSCGEYTSGTQVFMSYGNRPNSDLFLHNGFVHVDNISDGVKLRLGVSKSDPLVSLKTSLLQKLSIPISAEFLLPSSHFMPHGKFIAFLRIFNMDKENLETLMNSENVDDLMNTDVDFQPADPKTWLFLSNRIKLLLAAYPTSVEEDEDLLKTKLEPCRKLAILQRLTEKRVLINYLNNMEKARCISLENNAN